MNFRLTGSAYNRDSGRPIPTDSIVEDPVKFKYIFGIYFIYYQKYYDWLKRKKEEAQRIFNEAKKSAHIPTIFKVRILII